MEGEMNETQLRIDDSNEESVKDKIWKETKTMWIIAGPAILIRFSSFGVQVISQAFIGHVGATQLAAYSLVFTVLFRFVLGIQIGMIGGLGTLCGQAYGARQHHKLGIYLQQSWILLLTVSILLLPLFIFAAPILRALGQDERIAQMAATIALWFIPVVFSYAVLYSCCTFLQSQSKNFVLSCFSVASLLLHILLSWLLTAKFNLGVPGVMASTISAYVIPNLGQLSYVMFGGCRDTWKGFTTLAFNDLWLAFKLTMSSGVMICLEFWYTTILLLITGHMDNAEVTIDALTICLNISGWAMMISYGFLGTTTVRVSNELGRKDAKAAKFSIVMILLTSFAIAFLLFVFFLIFKERAAYMFTKNKDVAEAVARLSPFLAFTLLLNGIQPVLTGVVNGTGRQGTMAFVNLGSYYLIGIPLGVVLGYVFKLQVQGVWMGMIFGASVQTVILVIMTYRTDWQKEISLAQKRVNRPSLEPKTHDHSSECSTSENVDSGAASKSQVCQEME